MKCFFKDINYLSKLLLCYELLTAERFEFKN